MISRLLTSIGVAFLALGVGYTSGYLATNGM
jgi:hypothetical protein